MRLIMTADPDFVAAAWQELVAVAAGVRQDGPLAPGVWLASSSATWAEVTQRQRARPPIFMRHICPVDLDLPVTGNLSDLGRLQQAAVDYLGPRLSPRQPFAVQARLYLPDAPYAPFDVNQALAQALAQHTGAPLDVRTPRQVVSVVVGRPADQPSAWLGLSEVEENLSDWAGGARRFRRQPDQISRAAFKLWEACEVFRLPVPAGGAALDLGAAPGGWTHALRMWGLQVTAVDPAALHPSLVTDPGVHHRPITAEAFVRQLSPEARFTIIANDMHLDAPLSTRLMLALAPHLQPSGWGLLTLKLPRAGRPERLVAHCLTQLQRVYPVVRARQLFHNRREVTVALQHAV